MELIKELYETKVNRENIDDVLFELRELLEVELSNPADYITTFIKIVRIFERREDVNESDFIEYVLIVSDGFEIDTLESIKENLEFSLLNYMEVNIREKLEV